MSSRVMGRSSGVPNRGIPAPQARWLRAHMSGLLRPLASRKTALPSGRSARAEALPANRRVDVVQDVAADDRVVGAGFELGLLFRGAV